jgi:rhomboid protease GluP
MSLGPRRRDGLLSGFIPDDFPLATVLLLGVCVLFYFITVKATGDMTGESVAEPSGKALLQYGATFTPFVQAGEWWRFFSSIFLHGGLLHIAMNALGLFQLGRESEDLFGRARMLTVFILSGAAGMALSYALRDQVLVIGASGGIFGLMGLIIAHAVRQHGGRFTHELRARFIPWLLYAVIFSFAANVDYYAHLGGLAAGAACGWFIGDARVVRRLPIVWEVAAFAAVAWVAASLVLATRSPFPSLIPS